MNMDLTKLEHLNDWATPHKYWECPVCGDYARLYEGDASPACSCMNEDGASDIAEGWKVP